MNHRDKKRLPEKKGRFKEIRGLAYLAASLLLFVSLISFSPDDPSLNSVSTSPVIKNMTGLLGAYISDLLFSFFGGAAYLIPVALLISGWKRLRGEEEHLIAVRAVGFGMLLLSLPTFLHLHFERISLSIKGSIPAGGLIGDLITSALTGCCAFFGAHVITFTAVIISAVLVTGIPPQKMFFTSWNGLKMLVLRTKNKVIEKDIRREKKRDIDKRPAAEAASSIAHSGAHSGVEEPKIVEHITVEKMPPQQEHFEFMDITPDGTYKLPPLSILRDPPPSTSRINKEDLLMSSNILEKKLLDFGIEGQIVQVHPGPVITMYEFEPAPGVKLSRIVNLSDDLALAMKSGSVRIVAPLPGRSTVGIEVPNQEREDVYLKEIIATESFREAKSKLILALGRDIAGNPVVADLTRMPHLLVAGATGSGKSVALNTMISSFLFNSAPSDLKMVMIDPKILELSTYEGIPHLLTPVITQPKESSWALQKLVEEMQKRYRILADRGVRNIEGYNKTCDRIEDILPYIVVIIDELADLMMTVQREVEDSIARLAQMARASGIHLIVATQRPSVDVLTGVIKANFPARISFKVSSKVDSRTILDSSGAESLLDKGDMIFLPPGTSKLMRIHGAFISETEVRRLVDYIKAQGRPDYSYKIEQPEDNVADVARDEYYQQALDIVLSTGQASISLIQRRLRIGFNRAARLIEMMEEDGYVGPATGGKPRGVLRRKDG